eukprot:547905_1
MNAKSLLANKLVFCANKLVFCDNCRINIGRNEKQLNQIHFKQNNGKISGYNCTQSLSSNNAQKQVFVNKGCSLSDCISFTRNRDSMRTTDVKANENILATTNDSDSVQHIFDTKNEDKNSTIMMDTTEPKIESLQLNINLNSKFTTDQYSYGYHYWKFYKNNNNRADFAKLIPLRNYFEFDVKQTAGDWAIGV